MRIAKGVLVALFLPLLFITSCSKSKEDLVVAEVGDRVITLDTFEKTYFAVDPKYLPEDKGIEGLTEFLNTMINKDIMAIKADELGYDKDQYVVQGMEAFKKVSLQAAYLKFKVADRIKVTDKDLQAAYEKYQTNLQIKQILVDTKEQGEEVYNMIKQGHDFESVCKQYSRGPEAAIGGQVVNALWGTFEPNFQDALFDTPVGDVTPPLASRYGYFVIKVIAKNQPKKKPYEDVVDDLEKIITQQQQIRYMNETSDQIREKHGFEWYEDNLVIVFDAIPADRPLTSPPDRSAEMYPLLEFDTRDLDKPLASYDNKTITVRDFSDLYDRASFFNRPRREFRLGGIRKFVIEIVMNELVVFEMKESRIEEEPEIALALQKKKEQFMVDKLYQDLIDKQSDVTAKEQREYYDDNLEQFRRAEERRLGLLLVGDRDTATKAYKEILAGERFERVSAKYSLEEITREERAGNRFVAHGANPDIDEAGFELKNVGDVSEPFECSRGWMVVKLFERRPERILPFDEARGDIQKYIKTLKNEERLNSLLEKWRTEIDIQIYENNLKKANVDERPKKTARFA